MIEAGWSDNGYAVIIQHADEVVTLYSHLIYDSCYLVDVGQSVHAGEKIGQIGSSGNTTTTNLHFELRIKGVGRNQLLYLP